MGADVVVAVLAVARTAVRPVDGELAGWNPVELAGVVGREALERAGLAAGDLDEVIVGCADPVGACGADAARAIVLATGWPVTVGGLVIDRGETSGLAAVQAAAASIRAGQAHTVLAIGLGLCSVVPPGAAALNRTYGPPWGGVAERFAEVGGLLPAPRLSERSALVAGIDRGALDAAAEESRRRRAESGTSPAIVAVAARPGDAAGRGVYPGDPVAADILRDWGDAADLPPAFDDDGLLTAATFAPPADAVAAVLLRAVAAPPEPSAAGSVEDAVAPRSDDATTTHTTETQPGPEQHPTQATTTPRSDDATTTHTTETQPGPEQHPTQATTTPRSDDATTTHTTETQPGPGGHPAGTAAALESTRAATEANGPAALVTAAGMGRAAGDPFDPTGNVAVSVGRALAEAGVELDAVHDIAVVEQDAATVGLVARALGTDASRLNRAGGTVATGNAGAAEELRLVIDGVAEGSGGMLLTISAGPTGSAAIVWQTHI